MEKFRAAKPIWPSGREREKNLTVGFRAVVPVEAGLPAMLRITAASVYRVFLNGTFLGYGPARGPHGFSRVDLWDIPAAEDGRTIVVAVEVAGYGVNSYCTTNQPAFLQAEVLADGRVLAATGEAGTVLSFEAYLLPERVQKVQRYSFQRPFVEVYRIPESYGRWHVGTGASLVPVDCAEGVPRRLLPRRVPLPRFERCGPVRHVAEGGFRASPPPGPIWKDRSLTDIGPLLEGFPEAELEETLSQDVQILSSVDTVSLDTPCSGTTPLALGPDRFHVLDFGTNRTGFVGLTVRCEAPVRLLLTFDEILSGGDVDFKRLGCVNAIRYDLPAGTFLLESFEPYTLRYLKLMAMQGACEIVELYLREYASPDVWEAQFSCSDRRLNRLFDAGRETYRQNALDIFMDCPSRERAGWLCDSFFTGRVAPLLSGHTRVEHSFFENYRRPAHFAPLPDGMVPMCYPADHPDATFIPNWALWFVLELQEYLARSGDRETVDALRGRVQGIFDYLQGLLNEDGLLEKLESWVFLEWSAANSFVQDVNYPSNMLYAAALAAAADLYGRPDLSAQAEQVRQTVRAQSFDGTFFVDNAIRVDGRLQRTDNRTEVCQYYAFFTETATPQTDPDLWATLRDQFGPGRAQSGAFPEIHPANAFIGNYLRLELLARHGRAQQLLDESVDYLLYMAERTGTLWENQGAEASCNHGFASHIVYWLYTQVLGAARVDPVERTIRLQFSPLALDWCQGRIPLPDGALALHWWREGETVCFRADAPADYRLEVDNPHGLSLQQRP